MSEKKRTNDEKDPPRPLGELLKQLSDRSRERVDELQGRSLGKRIDRINDLLGRVVIALKNASGDEQIPLDVCLPLYEKFARSKNAAVSAEVFRDDVKAWGDLTYGELRDFADEVLAAKKQRDSNLRYSPEHKLSGIDKAATCGAAGNADAFASPLNAEVGEASAKIASLSGELDAMRDERDKLLAAIKRHHDEKASDRCWRDDDELYGAAGLSPADIRVGDKAAMMANCYRFIEGRCEEGGWKSYADLEAEIALANEGLACLRSENSVLRKKPTADSRKETPAVAWPPCSDFALARVILFAIADNATAESAEQEWQLNTDTRRRFMLGAASALEFLRECIRKQGITVKELEPLNTITR